MRRAGISRLVTSVIAAALLGTMCFGQPAAVAPPPSGVEISVQARPQKATVGDPIQIDLDITLPKGYQATLPKLSGNLGDFAILEFDPSVPIPGASAPAQASGQQRARIVAAVYKTGDFEFPPVQVTVRTPEGKELTASSRPLKIQIQSVLADKEPQLKPLKRQAEIREPVRWFFWSALALLLAALAALAWWLWQRRRRPASRMPGRPRVDPLVLAEADLHDLLGKRMLENGFVKQFYVALSDILKRLVEAGYEVQTIEKTTSEIMAELRNGSSPSDELYRIETVLLGCDLVKFAKYIPSEGENKAAVSGAFEILESVKRKRAAASVEEQTAVARAS